MAGQIASIRSQLGMGQYLTQTQGQASAGWGLGTSPYAVSPTPAPNAAQVQDRQGNDSQGAQPATDFEGLYAPTEYAHSNRDERVQGKIDFTQAPQKIEEIRSAPESQQALREYSSTVGAYIEGQEEAISREQIPLEFQELVRDYFDELEKDSAE